MNRTEHFTVAGDITLEGKYIKSVSPEDNVAGMEPTVLLLAPAFLGLMALSFSDQGC